MRVKNDQMALNKTVSKGKLANVDKNGLWLRCVLAALLTFMGGVLLISEVVTATTWVVPQLSLQMYRMYRLIEVIPAGTTFYEITVGDFILVLLEWGLPSLMMVLLMSFIHWKLIKFVFKVFKKLWVNAFRKKSDAISEDAENDKNAVTKACCDASVKRKE